MKVKSVKHLSEKFLQCDITTQTENFYVVGSKSHYLVHNSPAVKFGRDEQGRFHYGDKHSKEMNLSPETIEAQVMGRKYAGKGDPVVDAERQKFAQSQSYLWKLYESATPADFRGFVSGDLMWTSTPRAEGGEYVVTPNTVQYRVDRDSALGQQMRTSMTGVALHFYSSTFDGSGQPINSHVLDQLGNDQVTVLGPKTTADIAQANVNTVELDRLEKTITANANAIEEYLSPVTGLSNVPAVLYKYVNSHQADASPEHFLQWAQATLSAGQYAKLAAKPTQGLAAIFEIMQTIVSLKVSVIDQLENQALTSSGIRAILAKTNVPGGEGLVLPASGEDSPPLKFVNRNTFSAANRIR